MARIKILFLSLFIFTCSFGVNAQDSTSNQTKIIPTWVAPEEIFKAVVLTPTEETSIIADKEILKENPKSYENMGIAEMKNLSYNLNILINNLIKEKDQLILENSNKEAIQLKVEAINSLVKDKKIIDLTIIKDKLSDEQGVLLSDRQKLKRYLIGSGVGISILILSMLILFQRKRIKLKNNEILAQLQSLNKKNTYLEYAAKIIRHDMHSGINTYIPRGISSLERRLTPEVITTLKLESPLRLLKDGLLHTQKVYKGVYEFTNLVKKDAVLDKETCDLKQILLDYLYNTSYVSQVVISDLPTADVNQALFCTAIDNLIRNGLKYNDSDSKMVKIYSEDDKHIIIQDNGRGMTQKEFEDFSQPYTRKEDQKESGSGLGLNICVAILQEHKFEIICQKNNTGTKMIIKIK